MGASKVLGILSICIGWFIPIAGVILSIIGLSIKKEKRKENRDNILNIIGLIESILFWIVWWAYSSQSSLVGSVIGPFG